MTVLFERYGGLSGSNFARLYKTVLAMISFSLRALETLDSQGKATALIPCSLAQAEQSRNQVWRA